MVFFFRCVLEGPFWDIWSRPFSGKFPALDAWDLKQAFGTRGTGKNIKGTAHRVCYKELAVGIYGPASPVTVNRCKQGLRLLRGPAAKLDVPFQLGHPLLRHCIGEGLF